MEMCRSILIDVLAKIHGQLDLDPSLIEMGGMP